MTNAYEKPAAVSTSRNAPARIKRRVCYVVLADVVASGCMLFTAGCKFDVSAPPQKVSSTPPTPVLTSTVTVPLILNVGALRDKFVANLEATPLVQGTSPDLNARLLADDKTIFQQPNKVVDVAAKEASCAVVDVAKPITVSVKVGTETVSCALSPWKWGNCVRDVFQNQTKMIIEQVKQCTAAQAEVSHIAYTTIEQLTPKVFDTTVRLNYSVNLNSLTMEVNGSQLKATASLSAPVSVDIQQNLLVGSITVKGALTCTSNIDAATVINVSMVQTDGVIGAQADASALDLDVKKLCIPDAVQLVDAWSFTSLDSAAATRLVKVAVQKALLSALNDAVTKKASGFPLNDNLSKEVAKVQGVYPIVTDAWLAVEPKHVALSQIQGQVINGSQSLSLTASMDANLSVDYGAKPTLPAAGTIPVTLGTPATAVHLRPRGVLSLSKMASLALSAARQEAGDKLAKAGFEIANINVYQSNDLLVFAVGINSKSVFDPSGTLYLSGKPVYDPAAGSIVIENFDFTVESRNWLADHAAAVLQSKATEAIAKKLVFKVDDRLNKVAKQFASFTFPVGNGQLSGTTTAARLGNVWVQGDALNFDLIVDGQARLTLSL
ncbi:MULTISPECIES: DUF4403 family protein [Paraburkholderia]|uniref:DUF4403 family protein n=1 Tax=Paraburkholderia madseniana TaxID=2599607 RepID=A0AAP5BBY8_9BURK|nr:MULTISPECIES: DUF4403 family protein [Paraburkholderia]MCX4146895.1 DUF4403 family protein [Paraburkholderia madseniana]MDN7149841.1 DUF4403 family protein [Paraburkholderia sp. WS6]MDQ6408721.1 DUF4403 family protein [Paraburkholderia madseniana]